MRMLIRWWYVRRVAWRMVVGVRSGMVLMLGLRRERLGRGGRCPRPVVRPVAFIGAIHLQGRISSTQPEESHPPRSTRDNTKGPGTAGMIASARAPFDHSIWNLKSRPGLFQHTRMSLLSLDTKVSSPLVTRDFEVRVAIKETYTRKHIRVHTRIAIVVKFTENSFPEGGIRLEWISVQPMTVVESTAFGPWLAKHRLLTITGT